jgi:hypothetical protein
MGISQLSQDCEMRYQAIRLTSDSAATNRRSEVIDRRFSEMLTALVTRICRVLNAFQGVPEIG